MTKDAPFKYFRTSREIIRLAVMMYVRFPLSLLNVEDPPLKESGYTPAIANRKPEPIKAMQSGGVHIRHE